MIKLKKEAGLIFPLILALSITSLAREKDFTFQMKEGDRFFAHFENEKALVHYEIAHQLRPADFRAHLQLLRVNNSQGQNVRDHGGERDVVEEFFKRNVLLAEDLVVRHPKRAESYFSVAIAYGNLALYSSPKEKVRLAQNVEANLKKSIELDSRFPYSYLGLGIFYREVSRITFIERFFANLLFGEIPKASLEDAHKYFILALARDPNFLFTHYHFAKCLEYEGKYEEAYREYSLVLTLPRVDYGDLYLKELAAKDVQRIEKKIPSIPDIAAIDSEKPILH